MLIPAAMLVHYGVVLREERYLKRRFGESYRRLHGRGAALRLAVSAASLNGGSKP